MMTHSSLNLPSLLLLHQNASPSAIKILVGNKCDAESSLRMVEKEQAARLAAHYEVPFFECSCKHNINIQPMFVTLCERIGDFLQKNVRERLELKVCGIFLMLLSNNSTSSQSFGNQENHFNYEGQQQQIINDSIIKRLEETEANSASNANSAYSRCSGCVAGYAPSYVGGGAGGGGEKEHES